MTAPTIGDRAPSARCRVPCPQALAHKKTMKNKMMLMIAPLLALVLGYGIGDYRARHLAYNNWGFFVCGQMKSDLRWQENAAFYAYLNEPPAVAAWALEALINAYQRYAANAFDITGKRDSDYQSHEMFAHARLFKVYSSQNMADRAQLHLDRAIGLSHGKDADDLMQMVEWADKHETESSRPWAAPFGAQSPPSAEP